MSSLGRGTFLGGLATAGFLVLLFGGIWFFTPAPHRETTMKLPYARHAAPAVSVSRQFAKSDVILVAGGCGVGFHRGPYGYCVPNGPVAPPVAVGPRACPPGYYLGPHGRRCWPVGGGPRLPATGHRLPATGRRLPATGRRLGAASWRGPVCGLCAAASPQSQNPPRQTRILRHRRRQGSPHLRPDLK